MAQSTYALDYVNEVPVNGYAIPKREKQVQEPKVNTGVRVVPGEIKREASLSAGNLLRAIVCLIAIGAILVGSVFLTARATSIKYSINQLNKENAQLTNEISMLKVKVASANSIEAVETYATNELSMVYPEDKQTIYMTASEVSALGTAELIRSKVYN